MLPHAATVTRLRALFARSRSSVARSDKNKDGFIDGAELRELLTRGGNSDTKGSAMTEDDCTALISSFDDNGDGKLSIEEVRAPRSKKNIRRQTLLVPRGPSYDCSLRECYGCPCA
jgi:hypothetical protein